MKTLGPAVLIPAIILAFGFQAAGQTAAVNPPLALIRAAGAGDVAQVRQLLASGAAIDSADDSGTTPLMAAADAGQAAVISVLLEKGAKIDARSKDGRTALHLAARRNSAEAVRLLLEKGAAVDAAGDDGRTALLLASDFQSGNIEAVRLLLDKGANVEAADKSGRTALFNAVGRNNADVVTLLLDRRANPDTPGPYKESPLHYAANGGRPEIARLLIAKGADVGGAQSQFQQELIRAADSCNNLGTVRRLLGAVGTLGGRTNLNARDSDGQTALMRGVWRASCNADVVRFLLDNGADVNAFDRRGTTAIILASQFGHTDLVAAMIAKGANVNAQNDSGETALMLACGSSPHAAVVRVLIDKGANLNLQDKSGSTALDTAVFLRGVGKADFGFGPDQEREIGEIVRMLQQAGARCPKFCR